MAWTDADWRRCVAEWGERCAYCGKRADLTPDHVIPLASWGCPGTVPWNIVPACRPCNNRKADKPLASFCRDSARKQAIRAYLKRMQPREEESEHGPHQGALRDV